MNPITTGGFVVRLVLTALAALALTLALGLAFGAETPTLAQRWAFQFMTNGPATRTYVMLGTGTNLLSKTAAWTGRVMTHQSAASQFKPGVTLRLVEEFPRTPESRMHFVPVGAPKWQDYRTNRVILITPSTPRVTNVIEGAFRIGRSFTISNALWLTNKFSEIDAR